MKSNESGYRIPKDSKGCKFGNHWDEYLGERWMGSCPMFECVYDGEKEPLEVCEETDKCPAYEPCETIICPIHDIECFKEEYCELCHPEYKDMY